MTAVSPRPLLTVIVPVRNEARHLVACLDSILATEYPRDRLEVLVVDGASDDGSRTIAHQYAARNPTVRLLDNPGRTAPKALNLGIAAARGTIIARMDAHVVYPPHYLPRLVAALESSGADNVGGAIVTLPASDRPVARAIAAALAHPFGVGNSYFRIGASAERWVDTVPFGCWRREVLTRLGGFDEELVRNQDDELNHRLLARGGRILLVPNVVAHYHARESLAQVARMFYQYGLFKPLVARKVGGVRTARQLVPSLFILTLVVAAALTPWLAAARWALGLASGVYAGVTLGVAARALRRLGVAGALALALVFPVIHLSYGWGYLVGAVRWLGGGAGGPTPQAVPLSR